MTTTTIVVGVTNYTTALAACNRAFELAQPGDQIHPRVRGRGRRRVRDEPHRAILDVAQRTNADLIVVGNRGLVRRGRFTKATPARVLLGAGCSVLVVDTSDAAT